MNREGTLTHADYHVGSFTDVDLQWGERLWAVLNEPETVRSMTRSSDAGRTAAEAVAPILVERLGVQRDQRRVKMFIGHLIRQVTDQHRYQLERNNQTCQPNPLFTRGARYARRQE